MRKLNQAIAAVLRMPEVKEALRQQGLEHSENSPEEFSAWVKKQTSQWAKVIKEGGVKPD